MALPQLDPNITLANLTQPVAAQTPNDWRQQAATIRNNEAVARGNELEVRAAEDARRQTDLISRIAQESGGDWEVMIPRLRAVAPGAAVKFEQDLMKVREERAKAAKAELEQEAVATDRGLALLRAARDPETYAAIAPIAARLAPDLAGLLPEQFDPATLESLMTAGESAKDYIARTQESLKLLAEGKFNEAAGMALSTASDAEEWNETLDGLRGMGVPAAVLRQFGAFGPGAVERAASLAMSPDARLDNARDDARQRETQRHNEATEETARGQLGVSRGMLGVAQQNARTNAARATQTGSGGGRGGATDADVEALVQAATNDPGVIQRLIPTMQGKVLAEMQRRGIPLPSQVKLSAGQQVDLETMMTISQLADDIMAMPEASWQGVGSWGLGTISDAADQFFGVGNNEQRSLRNTISNVEATITKLRGGTALTPTEKTLIRSYTPTINDSDDKIRQKLRDLKAFVETKRANMVNIARGNIGSPTRNLDGVGTPPPSAARPSGNPFRK